MRRLGGPLLLIVLTVSGVASPGWTVEQPAPALSIQNPDFKRLYDFLVPLAKQSLERVGGYYPFSATLSTAGEIVTSRTYDIATDPDPRDVVETILKSMRSDIQAGKIRAAAICTDVTLTKRDSMDTTSEIALRLESPIESLMVHIPYEKGKVLGMKYGAAFSTVEPAVIFHETPPPPPALKKSKRPKPRHK